MAARIGSGNPLQVPSAEDLELTGISEDREGVSWAGSFCARPDEVIERGSEVLDCFPSEQGPFIRRRLPLSCDSAVRDALGRARFDLHAEHVCVSLLEGFSLRAKSLDLFYAPREPSLSGGLD